MNRWKAAAIHLSISFVLATTIAALLYFLWFPSPYFVATGANKLIQVLIIVDIGIGPLLTLLVVSPNKPRKLLKLDLTVIAILQVLALTYGIHVIALARPVFVVAAIDRIVLVSAEELDDVDLAQGSQPAFRTRSWRGPVFAGIEHRSEGDVLRIASQALGGGKDLEQLPRFYVSYGQVAEQLMRHAKPLSELKHASSQQIRELQARFGGKMPLILPAQRGDHDYTAIMSPVTSRPVLIVPINPW